MKGSGGWSDSLTCSIGGCRGRRGYRGSGSRTSRCSSPFLFLPQCNLLPCLPQPMFLLQLQSEKGETYRGVNEEVRHSRPLAQRFFSLSLSLFSFSLSRNLFTYRSCITGDMSPREAGGGGSISGLYLSPYKGYDGSPGNNGGLIIPHRSKYNCSSNLR